jgi:mRNA interferase RelE/StbE
MILNIELDNQPKKFLKKADKTLAVRILNAIENLKTNPFPQGLKRVVHREEKTFRIRVGDYRILYVVYLEDKTILISKIDKRPRVY